MLSDFSYAYCHPYSIIQLSHVILQETETVEKYTQTTVYQLFNYYINTTGSTVLKNYLYITKLYSPRAWATELTT